MFKTRYSQRYAKLLVTLVAAREAQSLTQVELAKRLEVTQSWVSKCERGTRRLDVVELGMWCEALGVSLPAFVQQFQETL